MEQGNQARGEAIRKLREALNISQEQLAQELGIPEDVVREWETGDLNPSQMAKQFINHLAKDARQPELDWNALERSHP